MKGKLGFTAIELMIAIAIIGILSSIAIPGFIGWRENQKLNNSARELQSFINGTRLAAIKNHAFVTVSFDVAARKVSTSQINRADENEPPRTNEIVLQPGISMQTSLSGNSFRFNSRGFPVTAINDHTSGTITVSNSKGKQRNIIMTMTGNTQIDSF